MFVVICFLLGLAILLTLIFLSPIMKVKELPMEYSGKVSNVPNCRSNVSFVVESDTIKGWLYLPESRPANIPCVILSHGFSGTKDCELEKYALQFTKIGIAASTYDYRHYGESGGMPRHFLSVTKQHNDLRGAIGYARSRNEIDKNKVFLWGTSAGANFGLVLAKEDKDIAGVICQCGAYDNEEDTKVMMNRESIPFFLLLFLHTIRDKIRGKLGLSRHMLPAFGIPKSTCFFRTEGIYEKAEELFKNSKQFRNEICAGFLMEPHCPDILKTAKDITCPVLVQVCEKDEAVSPKSHIRLIEILGNRGTLTSYPVGHFDINFGSAYENAIKDQIDFIRRNL